MTWKMFCAASVVAGCMVLAGAGSAAAQQSHNGNYLYNVCRNAPAVCQGYVAAVIDIMSSLAYLHGYRACIPPGISDARMADVVTRWLTGHPQMRPHRADILVARILTEAFPCG